MRRDRDLKSGEKRMYKDVKTEAEDGGRDIPKRKCTW
jgi:hypothetical protein